MRTHYDNLKVAENAPVEVIRAAYRALSQTHHPDRNPGDPEAVRIMQILNDAWEVLSDPERRAAYDLNLRLGRNGVRSPGSGGRGGVRPQHPWEPKPWNQGTAYAPPRPPMARDVPPVRRSASRYRPPQPRPFWQYLGDAMAARPILVVWLAGLVLVWVFNHLLSDRPERRALPMNRPSASQPWYPLPQYLRPALAPNGAPWPPNSGYVSAYVIGCADGQSSVMVDRSAQTADVWLKLVCVDGVERMTARVCLVKAGTSFTIKNVREGTYEVRFQNLLTGQYGKTRPFALKETETAQGKAHSQAKLTLAASLEPILPLTAAEFAAE